MKLANLFAIAAVAIGFASCKSLPDPEFVNSPGKFNTNKVQADLYEIAYTGTAGMSLSQAESIAGQRASALCIAEGFRYLIVLDHGSKWETRPAQPGAAPDSLAAGDHQVPLVNGRVRFFAKEPRTETSAVYDATQTQKSLGFSS
jgi:hypothetical protein